MFNTRVSLGRVVGWTLVVSSVIFWIGAFTPPWKQWMGPPLEEYLTIIGTHRKNWLFINGCFALSCVLTVPALGGLAAQLRSRGDPGWSIVGLSLFAVGAALWLVHLGHRLTITPWAASELMESGVVPPGYAAGKMWMGLLFSAYMVMAYIALSAFGAAILSTDLLPRWVGWTAVIFGLVALPGLLTPLFQPPLMVHVVPFIIGLKLLWPPGAQ